MTKHEPHLYLRFGKTSRELVSPAKAACSKAAWVRGIFCLAFGGLAIGCGFGGGRVNVKGRLTAQGKPVEHAVVLFLPPASVSEEPCAGRTGPDGSFTLLGARTLRKGAMPGEYAVRINRLILPDGRPLAAAATGGSDELPAPVYDSIPKQYTDSTSTPLKIIISATSGPLSIDLSEPLVENPAAAAKR